MLDPRLFVEAKGLGENLNDHKWANRSPSRYTLRPVGSPNFKLRFPASEIRDWADRYPVAEDRVVEVIGAEARERGFYSRDGFLKVGRWKSPRPGPRRERNDEDTVRDVTRFALSTQVERLRIEALMLLSGVSWRTASVLLHLGHRDLYPLLDFRALWSLGICAPPAEYDFQFWSAYTEFCRDLAGQATVDMRTLDRALWQYSKNHQRAVT